MLRVMWLVICWLCVGAGPSAFAGDVARDVASATADARCATRGLWVLFPVADRMQAFAAACEPSLSFDGERILFAGKRTAEEPLNIWEIDPADGPPRPITHEPVDCHFPVYLSSTYTLDAAAPVFQIAFSKVPAGERFGAIHTCRLDGTEVRRITFNPHGAGDPLQLSDGRLVYASWNAPGSAGQSGGTVLMTVNTDGTDVFLFACADEPPAIRRPLCETSDGWVVYVESRPNRPDGGSILAAVRRARSLGTRRVLGDEWAGLIRFAIPLSDGDLLVSHRPPGSASDSLFRVSAVDGTRTPVSAGRAFGLPPNTANVSRPSPPPSADGLRIQSRGDVAGHSSVVRRRVKTGRLFCLNAYLSDTAESARVEPDTIKTVRVIRATPATTGVQAVGEEVLGQAGVERDGSFYLEVPAEMPLRFETLDADGTVLQSMRSWAWVMPNEQRGCIGCHEDRELSPPNRHVFALRKRPHRLLKTGDRANGMIEITGDDSGNGTQ